MPQIVTQCHKRKSIPLRAARHLIAGEAPGGGSPSVGRSLPRRTRLMEADALAQRVWRPVPESLTAAGIAASLWAAFFGGAPGARRTAPRGLSGPFLAGGVTSWMGRFDRSERGPAKRSRAEIHSGATRVSSARTERRAQACRTGPPPGEWRAEKEWVFHRMTA